MVEFYIINHTKRRYFGPVEKTAKINSIEITEKLGWINDNVQELYDHKSTSELLYEIMQYYIQVIK